MGPKKAAELFAADWPKADRFVATLYGSLAATGKGHLTDRALLSVLEPIGKPSIEWMPKTYLPFHPNALKLEAFDRIDKLLEAQTLYSVGGGALSDGKKIVGLSEGEGKHIYQMSTMTEIMDWCEMTGKTYWEYVEECEGREIWKYLEEVW
ncbi:MAG TPA: serine dehydratase beta chain, partial [Chitinophagales bacterium]|nr:serine dehydratase beta chain [Chitinophagales bacterium]